MSIPILLLCLYSSNFSTHSYLFYIFIVYLIFYGFFNLMSRDKISFYRWQLISKGKKIRNQKIPVHFWSLLGRPNSIWSSQRVLSLVKDYKETSTQLEPFPCTWLPRVAWWLVGPSRWCCPIIAIGWYSHTIPESGPWYPSVR